MKYDVPWDHCGLNKKHKVDWKSPIDHEKDEKTGGRHGQGVTCQPKKKNSRQWKKDPNSQHQEITLKSSWRKNV